MVKIGKLVSTLIESGKRRIKTIVNGNADVINTFTSNSFGLDANAPTDTRTVFIETNDKSVKLIIGYVDSNQVETLNSGEVRIYSTSASGDAVSSFIDLRNDGTIEVLGTGDFFVRYNELETAYNQLKSDHDSLVSRVNTMISEVNTFATTYIPGSPVTFGQPPTFPFTPTPENPSTGDISSAKIDEIKTP